PLRCKVWTRIQSLSLQNERYLGALLRGSFIAARDSTGSSPVISLPCGLCGFFLRPSLRSPKRIADSLGPALEEGEEARTRGQVEANGSRGPAASGELMGKAVSISASGPERAGL